MESPYVTSTGVYECVDAVKNLSPSPISFWISNKRTFYLAQIQAYETTNIAKTATWASSSDLGNINNAPHPMSKALLNPMHTDLAHSSASFGRILPKADGSAVEFELVFTRAYVIEHIILFGDYLYE